MSAELWLNGSVILILIAIVGYFIDKWMKAVDKLTDVVSQLSRIVERLETNQNNVMSTCIERHGIVNGRFKSHSERIDKIEEEVTDLRIEFEVVKKQA